MIQSDDAHLAMLDPDSLSPGRKKLFVVGMVLASFLASLDLTGEPEACWTVAWSLTKSSGRNLYTHHLQRAEELRQGSMDRSASIGSDLKDFFL